MRTFSILLLMFCSVPCLADDGDWIGEVKPIVEPVADDLPNASIGKQLSEIRAIVDRLQKLVELVNRTEQPPAMPAPDPQVAENTARIEALENRLDVVETQLKALVTVRQADGTETTSSVEIDTVEGYGDFEVPVGGRVIAIDGVRIRNHFSVPSAPVANTQTYLAAPVEQQTIRIAPVQRAVSVFAGRYYTDADGCTVDRVTGRKISCPTR